MSLERSALRLRRQPRSEPVSIDFEESLCALLAPDASRRATADERGHRLRAGDSGDLFV
jgi:hypothetical protein